MNFATPVIGLIFLATVCHCDLLADLIMPGWRIVRTENVTQQVFQQPKQTGPPPIDQAAKFARYIVHQCDWGVVSHNSRQPGTVGYPMARVFSITDGTRANSTGVPYFYTSMMDEGTQDLTADNRCSMTMTLAESSFCKDKGLDTEDPRCPQVILTGKYERVKNNSAEWNLASEAMFSRHPEMKIFPKGHKFFFAKLNIETILLVDNVGGNKYPTVSDYFNSPPDPQLTSYKTVLHSVIEVKVQ